MELGLHVAWVGPELHEILLGAGLKTARIAFHFWSNISVLRLWFLFGEFFVFSSFAHLFHVVYVSITCRNKFHVKMYVWYKFLDNFRFRFVRRIPQKLVKTNLSSRFSNCWAELLAQSSTALFIFSTFQCLDLDAWVCFKSISIWYLDSINFLWSIGLLGSPVSKKVFYHSLHFFPVLSHYVIGYQVPLQI